MDRQQPGQFHEEMKLRTMFHTPLEFSGDRLFLKHKCAVETQVNLEELKGAEK